jgi:hypothetical protein
VRTYALAEKVRRETSDPSAPSRIDHYLTIGCFTGPRFDTAANTAGNFDANDLLAVAALSITINLPGGLGSMPISRAYQLLDDAQCARLLQDIPMTAMADVSNVDFDAVLGAESAAERLWQRLHKDLKIPKTATYKLLARKRPALLPVRDSVVKKRLYGGGSWWRALHAVLLAGGSEHVEELRSATVHAHQLPLLRVLDIAVWMAGTNGDGCGHCKAGFKV